MHRLRNGSQAPTRPAPKPVSGSPGYFTESGDNNVPSYPGADYFNQQIDEFQNMLAQTGVTYDPDRDDHFAQAFAYVAQQRQLVIDEVDFVKNREVLRCAQFENAIKAGQTPIIDCYGDSTMWGATVGNLGAMDPNNPPASLKIAIQLLFNVTLTVNNRAISGSTLRGMLTGDDGSGTTFESKIQTGGVSQNTSLIYCNHCINPSQLDESIDVYRDDLYTFIDLCRKYGKNPVLVTPNPNPILLIIDEIKSKRLQQFVRVMREVAKQQDVDLVDNFYYFSQSAKQIKINDIVPDGAHLSSAAYKQSGFNLAIPLISAGTLSKVGDVVGLEQTTWFDNGDISRQIQQRPDASGTRCGATLSFVRDPVSLRGLNYPVILSEPQKCISAICPQWFDGSKMNVFINSDDIGYPFSLEKNYGDDNVNSIDWDSENKIRKQMWAGLNVVQFLFNIATPSAQTGFAFSGLYLPPLSEVGMTTSENNSKNVIGFFDEVVTNFNFNNTSVYTLSDTTGSTVLTISKVEGGTPGQGVFTAKLYLNDGVVLTQELSPTAQVDGVYPVSVAVLPTQIDIRIVNIEYSLAIATPLPSLKVTSPWLTYFVNPAVQI